jgi:hypothetical protein
LNIIPNTAFGSGFFSMFYCNSGGNDGRRSCDRNIGTPTGRGIGEYVQDFDCLF